MYGKNKGAGSAKERWLARGVESLLANYPGLRVAYLDSHAGASAGGSREPVRNIAPPPPPPPPPGLQALCSAMRQRESENRKTNWETSIAQAVPCVRLQPVQLLPSHGGRLWHHRNLRW